MSFGSATAAGGAGIASSITSKRLLIELGELIASWMSNTNNAQPTNMVPPRNAQRLPQRRIGFSCFLSVGEPKTAPKSLRPCEREQRYIQAILRNALSGAASCMAKASLDWQPVRLQHLVSICSAGR